MNASLCDRCGAAHVGSRIAFQHPVPEEQRKKYGGAQWMMLNLELCEPCSALAFKHLKRFFGLRPFNRV